MDDGVSHLDLVHRASALRAAALRGDIDVVHTELCALRNDLVRHVHDETAAMGDFGPAASSIVGRGHRELLEVIDDLLGHAVAGGDQCRCTSRSVELVRAIARQAALENSISAMRSRADGRDGPRP